jgi:metal-responsive CopG/Arc/MetJ family transcriptional regulator
MNKIIESEPKQSRIELRLETSLLEQIDNLLDGRSRSEWIRRVCREKIEQQTK